MRERYRSLALASLLIAAGCGQRLAGTSTTTENTLTGVAMLPDGRPAAGAVVAARSPEVVLSRSHVPLARLLAQSTADSAGRFSLPLPRGEAYYLEVRRGDSVSWYRQFAPDTARALALGTVYLEPTVEVKGTVRPENGPWETRAWVGIAGTDLFRAVDPTDDPAGAAFSLTAAPAAAHALVVYDEPMVQTQASDVPVAVDSVAYSGKGQTRIVGQVLFHPGE
jgi:hypothetical protein